MENLNLIVSREIMHIICGIYCFVILF